MKKTVRRLLTLTLAACMGLMMTTGIASAKIENTTDTSEIATGDILDSNAGVTSNNPKGMIITYNDSGQPYTDTHYVDDSGWAFALLIPNDLPDESHWGYLFKWRVTGITDGADQSPDSLTLTFNSKDLIHYTIQYYDGNTLIHTQENVTAESNSFFHDGHDLKKDGYTFSHWTNESGEDILRPAYSSC